MRLGRSLFSLGCACQTRFVIDTLSSDTRRNPFDFNISTKQGILDGLRSEGESFDHAFSEAQMYRTPFDAQGPLANGIYFWHDYAKDEVGHVVDGWEAHHPDVMKKYRYLWPRFMERIRSEEPKTFIVSNTQSNLRADFTSDADDYERKFALNIPFFNDLVAAFDWLRVGNFEVLFLLNDVSEAIKLRALNTDPRLSIRFGGLLSNPGPSRWAYSLLLSSSNAPRIDDILGHYDSGMEIVYSGPDLAIAYREDHPFGEISVLPDAYLIMMPGTDAAITAIFENGTLKFSNKVNWKLVRPADRVCGTIERLAVAAAQG